MKKPFAIILDSSSGKKVNPEDKDLFIYPLTLTVNSKEYIDEENKISFDDIYELQQKYPVTTSQGSPYALQVFIENILEKYKRIYFLPISSQYSGLKNAATLLSIQPEFQDKLMVFETNSIFLGLEKLVNILRPHFEKKLPAKEIQEIIDEESKKFIMIFVPNDISYLRKGGRIGKAEQAIANLLRLKPVFKLTDSISLITKARTFSAAWIEGMNYIKNNFLENDKFEITLLTSSKDDKLNAFAKEQSETILNKKILKKQIISNCVLAHIGPETLGLFVQKVD